VVALLLKHKADPAVESANHETAIDLARASNLQGMVDIMQGTSAPNALDPLRLRASVS